MSELRVPEGFVHLNSDAYRTGTIARRIREHFLVGNGGIGDLICYLRALQWIAETQPQVMGVVWTFPFIEPLARNILEKYNWEFKNVYEFKTEGMEKEVVFTAYAFAFNAAGTHSLDLGFMYYNNHFSPPSGYNNYPRFNLADVAIPSLPERYAVLTPGATSKLRALPADIFNGIKEAVIKRGMTPIFLGKEEIATNYEVKCDAGYDYTGGINLINKTNSLLEAARIIDGASLCIGLDNGLMHLAGCTNTPLVIGYNVADPAHRLPRREHGKIATVIPDIACKFCQSHMRHLNKDLQKICLYNDLACLPLLTLEKWEKAIDEVLS